MANPNGPVPGPRFRNHLTGQRKPYTPADPFGIPESRSYTPGEPGSWFEARWDGECSSCGEPFDEGDLIRGDGDGGYEGQDCCGD
jgi:hypothetical protein